MRKLLGTILAAGMLLTLSVPALAAKPSVKPSVPVPVSVPAVSGLRLSVSDDAQRLLWNKPADLTKIAGYEVYAKKDGDAVWALCSRLSATQTFFELAFLPDPGQKTVRFSFKVVGKAKAGFKDSGAVCGKTLTYVYEPKCNPMLTSTATILDGSMAVSATNILAKHDYLLVMKDAATPGKVTQRVLTATRDRVLDVPVDKGAASLDKIGNRVYLKEFFGLTHPDGSATMWATGNQLRGVRVMTGKTVMMQEVGAYAVSPALQKLIDASALPEATPQALPYWTGFNLCNKMNDEFSSTFEEQDIRNIHDMGFNFVRVAVHYKTLLTPDETRVRLAEIEELDRIIEWGIRYNVHINLDLHYLPGHGPSDQGIRKQDLFVNEANQQAACADWAMLARRYAALPNKVLSFNLINEPHWETGDADYARVMEKIISAVRAEDADRLMVIDGLKAGNDPSEASKKLGVAQSTHFYEPACFTTAGFNLSGGQKSPLPQSWPMEYVAGQLWGSLPSQPNGKPSTITANGTFAQGMKVRVNVDYSWAPASIDLVVRADGAEILRQPLTAAKDRGLFEAVLPAAANAVTVGAEAAEGFVNVSWVSLVNGARQTDILTTDMNYEQKPLGVATVVSVDETGIYRNTNPADQGKRLDIDWMRKRVKLWKDFAVANQVGILCGEFGVANTVPHPMMLAYLRDWLTVLQENGIGWSFYEYTNWFGIFNSNRADVKYEKYGDQLLDRDLLTLLQQFQKPKAP